MGQLTSLRIITGIALSLALSLISGLALSEPVTAQRILILNSYDSHSSPYSRPARIFKNALQARFDSSLAFREVNIESNWSHGPSEEAFMVEMLNRIFLDPTPDLIVAIGPPAIDFWLRHRDALRPDTPIIAAAGDGWFNHTDLRAGDVGVVTAMPFSIFIDNMLKLKPEIENVVMVFGHSPHEQHLAQTARVELKNHEARLDFEYTSEMTFEEIETSVSRLGEESAVFYGLINYDADGFSMERGSALQYVRAASAAPVFGAFDEQLGAGIVGGRLIDLEGIGVRMAEAAVAILEGRPDPPTWINLDLTAPIYDWAELKAWGIPENSLPEGSEVRFRVPTLLEAHFPWIVLTGLVLLFQSALIVFILLERIRRQKLERAQVDLSGKLITAHEDERRRIARELHDDVSQRLARLSMDAAAQGSLPEGPELSNSHRDLAHGIAGVSKDLHDISYRLHPSLLYELGVSAALHTECQQVAKHTNARIEEHIDEIEEPLDNEVALCIYRIAQEALRNAVRHAGADSIRIKLKAVGTTLMLSVRDNGHGFDCNEEKAQTGLGLSSMRERARLLGGALSIRSRRGQGTEIIVTLPLEGIAS